MESKKNAGVGHRDSIRVIVGLVENGALGSSSACAQIFEVLSHYKTTATRPSKVKPKPKIKTLPRTQEQLKAEFGPNCNFSYCGPCNRYYVRSHTCPNANANAKAKTETKTKKKTGGTKRKRSDSAPKPAAKRTRKSKAKPLMAIRDR